MRIIVDILLILIACTVSIAAVILITVIEDLINTFSPCVVNGNCRIHHTKLRYEPNSSFNQGICIWDGHSPLGDQPARA